MPSHLAATVINALCERMRVLMGHCVPPGATGSKNAAETQVRSRPSTTNKVIPLGAREINPKRKTLTALRLEMRRGAAGEQTPLWTTSKSSHLNVLNHVAALAHTHLKRKVDPYCNVSVTGRVLRPAPSSASSDSEAVCWFGSSVTNKSWLYIFAASPLPQWHSSR